jgi:hypothetical protein
MKAIIRQIPAYGNVTWLEVAMTAEAKEFIAHRAVQDVLNNIWYIKIKIFKRKCAIFNLGLDILINERLICGSSFQQL